MNDKSEICYWHDEENILTVPTSKVPFVGEEIYIDSLMDREWYDIRFPKGVFKNQSQDSGYHKGVRGYFIVTDVKRYYKSYDYVFEDKTDNGTYRLPAQRTVETFEVYLEKKEKD